MSLRIDSQALARKHLDRRFAKVPTKGMERPPKGWLRAIRDALGLTSRQLAARVGRSHSTIIALEQGEVLGTVSLNSLRDLASAMDCSLTYALVPNKPLEETVYAQSQKVAAAQLRQVDHTMRLENQAIPRSDFSDQVDRLAEELRRKGGSALWG